MCGINVVGGGGGGLKFSICGSKNCFSSPALVLLPLPSFRHPIRSEQGKVQKGAKSMRSGKCSLAPYIAGYAPPLSVGTVLCTHKRDFATVTLIPGRG